MSHPEITFEFVMDSYHALLLARPGFALDLDNDEIAVLIDGEVTPAVLEADHSAILEICEYDPRGFDDYEGAERNIATPKFIDVSHLDFVNFESEQD
jgi:hypothetical protein